MRAFIHGDIDGNVVQIFALVGELSSVVETFSEEEAHIFSLFFTGAENQKAAYDAYHEVMQRRERFSMLQSVAKNTFEDDVCSLFEADLKKISRVYRMRNEIMHSFIGPEQDNENRILQRAYAKENNIGSYRAHFGKLTSEFIRQAIYEAACGQHLLFSWKFVAQDTKHGFTALEDNLQAWRDRFDNGEKLSRSLWRQQEAENGPPENPQ